MGDIRKITAPLVTLLLIFISIPAFSSESISLEEAIQSAVAGNPTIQGSVFEEKAAKARPSQAASLPDPTFMFEAAGVPIDSFDVGDGDFLEYMIEQQIPFPAKLRYGYKAEKHESKAKESKRFGTTNEIVRATTRAYADLWRAEREKEINQRTLRMYSAEKSSAETGYASSTRPVADPVRASVDMGEIEGRMAVLEQERLSAVAELSALTGRHLDPYATTRGLNIPKIHSDLGSLVDDAKNSRPEVSEAESMIASSSARLSLAKSQYAPDLVLRLGYMDMPGSQQSAWLGRVSVSFPLWFLSRQRFGVKESKALLGKAKAEKEIALLGTEADVRSAYAAFNAAKETVRIYEGTVVTRAKILVESSKEAYRNGKGNFRDLVDGIRRLNDAEIMLVRAKADVVNSFADLEKAVGRNI